MHRPSNQHQSEETGAEQILVVPVLALGFPVLSDPGRLGKVRDRRPRVAGVREVVWPVRCQAAER